MRDIPVDHCHDHRTVTAGAAPIESRWVNVNSELILCKEQCCLPITVTLGNQNCLHRVAACFAGRLADPRVSRAIGMQIDSFNRRE